MIPIVEDYLIELIENRVDYLKNNPQDVHKILNTSKDRLDRLSRYLKDKPIKVIKGYPRTPAELPCIVLLLSGEDEMQEGLGDYSVDENSDIKEYSEEVPVLYSEGSGMSMPYVELTHKPINSVTSMTHNQLGIEIEDWEYEISDSSRGIVGLHSPEVENGDTLTVSYTYKSTVTESTQVLYDSTYKLEIWTLNGDLTVELYHLLKWALLSGRDHLGKDRELFRQKLSGSDLQPAPSYFPEFVYRRALTFWCQFTASSPSGVSEYIQDIVVNDDKFYTETRRVLDDY